jgi:thiamine-phosphate diphosphorylase
MGQRLLTVARAAGVPLIVNDRADVALAIGADGVHVGHPDKEDLPPELCRRVLGPSAVVGVSVDQEHEARAADAAGASYLSAGPIHATATKSDAGPAAGPALIRRLRGASRLPLIGIGGITAENAGAVIAAGADGVAVASSVLTAPDPAAAARALRSAVEAGLRDRTT